MDLRQFTTTPNNFDDQRRTSISSTSTGYASSSYGGAPGNHNSSNTPNARLTQSRYFGQVGPPPGFHSSLNGNNISANVQQQGNSNWLQQGVLNVTPWIEQQQEVSNNASLENQNFVNSYGQNLNSFNANNNVNGLVSNQSIQATYDSRSTRASPSLSLDKRISDRLNDGTLKPELTSAPLNDNETMINENDDNNNNSNENKKRTNKDDNEQYNNDNEHANDGANEDKGDKDNREGVEEGDVNDDDDDDELIPTAIVIKNIPFAIKKEQLLDVMTKLSLPLPYAFNYHFDNGVFRGLAFANFTSTDETTAVVTQLNGREIGGRKLRVEYKKMLPLAERERIEREKREKRGQLEEQHRSTSNASLASMMSAASAPAGGVANSTPSVSINPSAIGGPPGLNHHQQQHQSTAKGPNQSGQPERFYAPIPFANNLPIQPQQIDFNDAETLEYYSQLLVFRDDKDRTYSELAYPASLSLNHKRIISILAGWLGLIESNDGNLILIKKRSVLHDPSPLLRSQSQSAIPLLQSQLYINSSNNNNPQPQQLQQAQLTGGQLSATNLNLQQQSTNNTSQQSQRYRNQGIASSSLPQSPAQQHSTNPRIPPAFSLSANQQSLSSAAILRNNPTPTRMKSNNTFYTNQPQSTSQPNTPGFDASSGFGRFGLSGGASSSHPHGSHPQPLQPQQSGGHVQPGQLSSATSPFAQHGQLSYPNQLQQGQLNQGGQVWDPSGNAPSSATVSSHGVGEQELNEGINGLNLGLDNGSSIWGPRS